MRYKPLVDKWIVWQRPSDGHLVFTIPCEPALPGESEAMYLDRIAMAALSQDARLRSWQCVRVGETDPIDKRHRLLAGAETFLLADGRPEENLLRRRECLRWDAARGQVTVDMALYRNECLRCLRAERGRRLLASDGERNRIEEIGTANEKHAMRQYRQALRDLPATVAADLERLTTPAELESYRPAWPEPSA